ncbi:hypothetical protein Tco_0574877, partial [Tanacetum coccineum]
ICMAIRESVLSLEAALAAAALLPCTEAVATSKILKACGGFTSPVILGLSLMSSGAALSF